MNVNECLKPNECCGCGACAAACPTNAIAMVYSETDWHIRPSVLADACIDCGKCVKKCPALAEKKDNGFTPFGYAAIAKDDIRKVSTSGGMFLVLAKHILFYGGYVAGAVYTDDLSVKHIVSSDKNDLMRMSGSKYVQSDATEAYKEVLRLLKEKKTVLFSGTPCQVAAMKLLAAGHDERLICVDILCHGVPSQKYLEYYLDENFDRSQIETVLFRNKEHRNGMPGSLTVVMKNGERFYSEYFDNSYYDAFLKDVSHRPSCFDCKYAQAPRVGDISIGDFWAAKTTDTKIDYEKGSSIAIINSPKGKRLWKSIARKLKIVEEYPVDVLMSWNRNKRILEGNKRREELVEKIKKHNSFRVAVSDIVNDRYEVGVFGVTMNPNFGGLITYWALYEALLALGYKTAIIDKPLFWGYDPNNHTHSHQFFYSRCNIIKSEHPHELYKLNEKVDRFVIGSDQVWNYNLFRCWEGSLYLDFASDYKQKIAYAASFGHDHHSLPPEKRGQVSDCFKRFDFIGVRESDGVKILSENYGVDATHVLDPVFLLPSEKYVELTNESKLSGQAPERFVGSYIIEPNDFKLSVIKQISEELGLPNLNTTDGDREHFARKSAWFKDRDMHIQHEATVQDWLYVIKNSEIVITDSFHAVCFSIMLGKPFVLLQERWALSRIESIMNLFGLHERWLQISDIGDFKINPNWFLPLPESIQSIWAAERERSLCWLKSALESKKRVRIVGKPTPLMEHKRVEDYFYFLMRTRSDYIITLSSCNFDTEVFAKIDFKSKLSYIKPSAQKGGAFAMLFDYDADTLVMKSDDYSEITYGVSEGRISCLVDKSTEKKYNSVSSASPDRELLNLSTEAGVVISVYSKQCGRFVDSFEVVLENGVAVIKR